MSANNVCILRQRAYYELPVRREAEALRDAGYEVDVLCLRGPGEPAVEVDAGVTLHRLRLRRRRGKVIGYVADYLAFFVLGSLKLTRLHLRRRYRVIQVNTMPDLLVFATLIPRLLGAKVIAFMKEPTPELGTTLFDSRALHRLLVAIEQLALRYAHLTFTVTEPLRQRYVARGADPSKIHVVLNGPDTRHLAGVKLNRVPGAFNLICHGSVEERYGHDTILAAVQLVEPQIAGLQLTFTGTGDFEPEVKQLIEDLGLGDTVSYRGWVEMDEVLTELSKADVGLVAQKSSPYSNLVHTNKMYEYMILGIPVIASRLEAVVDTFDDSTVRYFHPADAHSLAEAILDLYNDPAGRAALAERATRRYEKHSWDVQRGVLLAGYRTVLGG